MARAAELLSAIHPSKWMLGRARGGGGLGSPHKQTHLLSALHASLLALLLLGQGGEALCAAWGKAVSTLRSPAATPPAGPPKVAQASRAASNPSWSGLLRWTVVGAGVRAFLAALRAEPTARRKASLAAARLSACFARDGSGCPLGIAAAGGA